MIQQQLQQTEALSMPQSHYQSGSLYVGDLAPEASERILFDIFNRVGPVTSIRICRDVVSRRSLGYAYVNFSHSEDAERALDTMNFTEILGRQCRMMWSQRDPRLRKSGLGNIFIKHLPESVDSKTLFDTFSVFGNILSCKVPSDPSTGKSKGYGYVHFETSSAATEAVAQFNGNSIDGQEVSVCHFVRPSPRQWTNLYVKQFYRHWDEQKLADLFSPFGTITSLHMARDGDAEGSSSQGWAFVNMSSHEEAEAAVAALNGKLIEDASDPSAPASLQLCVNRAQTRAERREVLLKAIAVAKRETATRTRGCNLYVKRIDERVTDENLRAAFAVHGTVTSARVMRDPEDRDRASSRGFGFVSFASAEQAAHAMAMMHGHFLMDKPLFVALHQTREERDEALRVALAARFDPSLLFPMPSFSLHPHAHMQRQDFGHPAMGFPSDPGAAFAYPQLQGQQWAHSTQPPRGHHYQLQHQHQHQHNRPQQQKRFQSLVEHGSQAGPGSHGSGGAVQLRPMRASGAVHQQRHHGHPSHSPAHQNTTMNHSGSGARTHRQAPLATPPTPTSSSSWSWPCSGALNDLVMAAEGDPQAQKNMIGEQLYPLVYQHQPACAGKVTGMLLEMDNAELLHLIESPEALVLKVAEAMDVLRAEGGDVAAGH